MIPEGFLMAITGLVAFLFGILLVLSPTLITRLSDQVNRHLQQTDAHLMRHRLSAGICLIGIGIFCIASAYYVWIRLTSY